MKICFPLREMMGLSLPPAVMVAAGDVPVNHAASGYTQNLHLSRPKRSLTMKIRILYCHT